MEVKALTSVDFSKETASGVVLVDFWASWCGPCRMMAPTVEDFAGKHPEIKVFKVNVDDEPALADNFSIDMIPALVFIRNGTEFKRSVGIVSLQALEESAEEALK